MKVAFDISLFSHSEIALGGYLRGVPRYLIEILKHSIKQDFSYFSSASPVVLPSLIKNLKSQRLIPKRKLHYSSYQRWFPHDDADTIPSKLFRQNTIFFFPHPGPPLLRFIERHPTYSHCVLAIHDLMPLLYPEYNHNAVVLLYRDVLRKLSRESLIFTPSESTRRDVLNLSDFPEDRVISIPLSADPTYFYPHKSEMTVTPYILSLGPFIHLKQPHFLARVFLRWVQEDHIEDVNLVLAGSVKGYQPEVAHEIALCRAEPGMESRILLPGAIEDSQLPELYSGALCFAYPSIYEGFGLPPLEAMSCGTPIIASNSSSLPDLIGDAGILLDPEDISGWCRAFSKIYRDASLRKELIAKGYKRAQQFSWERTVDVMWEGFRNRFT